MSAVLLTTTLIAATPPLGPIKQIDAGVLNIGYAELGPATGLPWSCCTAGRTTSTATTRWRPCLAAKGYRVIVPYLRGYGTTRFLSTDTFRNAQQSAVALDVIKLMDALGIGKAILGGFDWGSRTVDIVAALWPERCKGIVAGADTWSPTSTRSGSLSRPSQSWMVVPVLLRHRPRPHRIRREPARFRQADLEARLAEVEVRQDAAYDADRRVFRQPDHVDIVIHNYRWRLGLAKGEPQYDAFEQKLAERPPITVPAITIASDFDGPLADGKAYASLYTGKHSHRVLKDIGHDVPQEAPAAFAQAIVDVDRSLAMSPTGLRLLFAVGFRGGRIAAARDPGQATARASFPSLAGATGWLNSPALTAAGLRGKVVLVDFWTFTCVNWLRTLPYLRAWATKYKDQPLVIIGVHTPEFGIETGRRGHPPVREGDGHRVSGRGRQRLRRLARLRQPLLAGALRVRCAGPPAASPIRRRRVRARGADRPAAACRGRSSARRPAGDGRDPRHRGARRPRPRVPGNVRRPCACRTVCLAGRRRP